MSSTPNICSRLAGVFAATALLVPTNGLLAQFRNEQQPFEGTSNTFFAIPEGSVPYWSVDGACSPALLFKDGTRGDNGSSCLRSLLPVGTGTRMILDLRPGPDGSTIGDMKAISFDVITRLFVSADDGSGVAGQELYRVLQPLYPVMTLELDIDPGTPGSNPSNMFAQYDKLYFAADDGTNGVELWKATLRNNLTVATALLKDINPLAGSSSPAGFALLSGSVVMFSADDGTTGRELWKTDGTNTTRQLDINQVVDPNDASKTLSSDPQLLTTVSGKVFFTADDGVNGRELWMTDGTTTMMVLDIVSGAAGSNPTNLTAATFLVGGAPTPMLCFTVDSDGMNGAELWKSNGTAAGTMMIYDPGSAGSPANLRSIAGTVNRVFFTLGNDLWKSDGTMVGTVPVKTFVSAPTNLVVAANTLYFVADDNSGGGLELWKSDGTTTSQVMDIRPGAVGSSPQNLFAIGSTVYFSADDGTYGRELWRTDSAAGALRVMDINPGPADSAPSNMANFDGTLVFTADDGTHGRELWQSDGFPVANRVGMSYKWDLATLISNKGDPGKMAFAVDNTKPLYIYWLHDFPAMGGPSGVSEGAHEINTYVELTDGTDRAPLNITNVDCGDGNLPRPRAALTDGTNHNAIAFGMVAVLDQDPCDTDSRGPGSPSTPFAYVPAVYDGLNWIPMDMAHITPAVPTAPPSGTALGQTSSFAYLWTGMPSNLVPATVDPWSTKRFTFARLDVWSDYLTVMWGGKQNGTIWVATVPRQYKGGFSALYFGNKGCVQPAYPFYLDSLTLNGGVFTSSPHPVGACCLPDSCVDGVISDTACAALGGSWAGFDTTCDGSACLGACCRPMAVCTETLAGACDGDFLGVGTNCATATCPCHSPRADADWDGDVDQVDFSALQGCYSGPGPLPDPLPAGCKCFDRDLTGAADGDVDADDYDAFEKCASGPGVPLDPACEL
ncbi:MAG TPA: hypothetical protein PLL20_16575 [Phycisphaerae bacterium]|nr:hypothetical protein [Phycisphaerae bacterium]HRR85356.1 hypothetical protein [Phycisphaerae bacterium]